MEHLFFRSYLKDAWWYTVEYKGTFFNIYNKSRLPFDSVAIRSTRYHKKTTEVLHYKNENDTCAVFWVLSSTGYTLKPYYDLRMKDSYVKAKFSPRSDCWKEFKNVTERRKTKQIYYKSCQYAVNKKLREPTSTKLF
uniref:Putative lipocalin n=1 Tax=Rhipicephalus microplus TaxID=6941 RepID=A0A6G5A078_RHIMP